MSATLALPRNITTTMFNALRNGATGGTYSVDGKSVPTTGYFVGGVVPSMINPRPAAVEEFIESAPADYVGFWEDSSDLRLYVDAVDWTESEAFARRLAILRGEVAYWDVAKGEEVRVREEYAGYAN